MDPNNDPDGIDLTLKLGLPGTRVHANVQPYVVPGLHHEEHNENEDPVGAMNLPFHPIMINNLYPAGAPHRGLRINGVAENNLITIGNYNQVINAQGELYNYIVNNVEENYYCDIDSPSVDGFIIINPSVNGGGEGSNGGGGGGSERSNLNQYRYKYCTNYNCRTIFTPMWRKGPLGLNTLCNACGLKFGKDENKKKQTEKILKLAIETSSANALDLGDESK